MCMGMTGVQAPPQTSVAGSASAHAALLTQVQGMAAQTAPVSQYTAPAPAQAPTQHHAAKMPGVPPQSPTIKQLLVDGSYGQQVKKGKAKNIQIPDGKGFGGVNGRKQNADDKTKNDYSVTDANFYNMLGVLKNPANGKPFNYVQQIQAYNAAGYVATFHPDAYARMTDVQNRGGGSILGMALNLMGAEGAPTDPGLAAAGLTAGMYAKENVPGSTINAKGVVMSGKDITGEEWARPHHAESSWAVYKKLNDAGVDWKSAMALSGDDSVSGSGRLNGFNGQDGKTGFNADEKAIFQMGAVVQQQTGIPVIQLMAGGHAHTNLDASAKTNPNINKLIGLAKNDRSSSPDRMARVSQALIDGTITGGNAKKFKIEQKGAYAGAGGTPPMLQGAITAVDGRKGKGAIDVPNQRPLQSTDQRPPVDGPVGPPNTEMPPSPMQDGCGMDHDATQGVGQLGGPVTTDLQSVLKALIDVISRLAQALSSKVDSANGGGPGQLPQQKSLPVQAGGGQQAGAAAALLAPAAGAQPAVPQAPAVRAA